MTGYEFTIIIEPDEDGFHAFVPAFFGRRHSLSSSYGHKRDADHRAGIEQHL